MNNHLPRISGFIFGIIFLFSHSIQAQTVNPFSVKKKKNPSKTKIKQDYQIQEIDAKSLQATPKATFYNPIPYQTTVPTRNNPHMMEITKDAGVPIFIKSANPNTKRASSTNPQSLEQSALDYLEEIKEIIPVKEPKNEFELKSHSTDDLGMTHIKMQQTYQGVPVYASEVIVHFSNNQEVVFNGRYKSTPTLADVVPDITPEIAEQSVIQDVSAQTNFISLTEAQKEILHYDEPENELVIYQAPTYVQAQKLAWHITIRPNFIERWEYFVDAKDGSILHSYNHTCSIGPVTGTSNDLLGQSRTINSFEVAANQFVLLDASKNMYTGSNTSPQQGDGYIITADMNNTDPQNNPSYNEISSSNKNNWSATAVSAHYNSGLAYDYFETTHSRNSIDGNGGDVVSFINVSDGGSGMDNAFWNGQAMFYGNGKNAFDPLAGSLDVGGHEMTHGVVQSTANLEYQGQSGALNESFADIFAVMIDRDDWLLGDDIVKLSAFPSGALRSLSDPHNGGSNLNSPGYQPKVMSEIYTGNQDNGGVHINSGIVNYVFYLFATDNSKGMNKAKAEKIYYRALDKYLTRSSQFVDCRSAVVQAATDLHGANSQEVAAAQDAFSQVGIGAGSGGGNNGQNYQAQLPVNPGQDFIVSSDINVNDVNTLYISSTTATNYQPLSQTAHRNKISVSDDGSTGFFVGEDHHIYRIFLNPSNPQQIQFSNTPDWDNVAISKDGSRLAAVSNDIDTAIYVFDLTQNPIPGWKFTLYNPTTAQGVNTGDVLYADAIEWDYSGEYIMYDAVNRIKNNSGQDLEYFDIGFLQAWNNASNSVGGGLVSKLFSNVPEGVNVGNGVFSKNSASVIAFDLFDLNTGNSEIKGANIETGDLGTIFNNAIIGYPSFSKLDDRIIFNAIGADGVSQVVAYVDLQNDKINASGGAFELVPDAQWGVWYSTGTRDISIGLEEELKEGKISLFPNPTNNDFQLDFELLNSALVSVEVMDLVGKIIHSEELGNRMPGEIKTNISLRNHPSGAYLVRLRINNSVRTLKLLKN